MSVLLALVILAGVDDFRSLMDDLRASRQFSNGRVVIEMTWPDGAFSERVDIAEHRFYGDDSINVWRFDVQEPAGQLDRGTPVARRCKIGEYYVRNADSALQSSVGVNGYDLEDPPPDVLQIGCFPVSDAWEGTAAKYWEREVADHESSLDDLRTVTQHDGDLILIRVKFGADDELLIWRDPARDNQVIRSQWRSRGRVTRESVTQLAPHGRTWFPKKVDYFVEQDGGLKRAMVVRVTSATFDDPDMVPLTLADAGIDVGTNIYLAAHGGERRSPNRTLMGWDGATFLPFRELSARIRDGELLLGSQFQRDAAISRLLSAGSSSGTASRTHDSHDPAERISAWRKYTLDFIARYQLNEEQRQTAMQICTECETAAYALTRRMGDRIAKIEALREDALDAALNQRADALALDGAFRDERTEVLSEIRAIFERQLEPRLRNLLTRRQLAIDNGVHDKEHENEEDPK